MIDTRNLAVVRLTMHTIKAKTDGQTTATLANSTDVLAVSQDVMDVLLTRVNDAIGHESKAFELKIDRDGPDSMFYLVKDADEITDVQFVKTCKKIAQLLATAQRKPQTPGGYCLILHTRDKRSSLPAYLIIKAEPHAALQLNTTSSKSQLQVLKDVFLSPSQKLYKIGGVYQKKPSSAKDDTNDLFGCFLFDDQFRPEKNPAAYFYDDFLGFTTSDNAKIQTKLFHDKTASHIRITVSDGLKRQELMQALKTELLTNNDPLIHPAGFGNKYFKGESLDDYLAQVAQELPSAIEKNPVMVEKQLRRRKINFPKEINIIGPDETFDSQVTIIKTKPQLEKLAVQNVDYTVVKIKGKPYSDE